jgi:alginate O-acetyltransferase complex protein AlgJ
MLAVRPAHPTPRAAGVNAVDLNSAFMNSPKRTAEVPLFLRLDTHWSATGALLAAETIRDALATMPDVKKAYDAIPAATYKLTWADQRWPFEGDLVQQLPKGSPAYEKDMISVFRRPKSLRRRRTGWAPPPKWASP